VLRFFTCLAIVPVIELLVVRRLRLAFLPWYHGLVAVIGVAVLAAVTLHSLRQRGHLMMYRLALCAVLATSLPLLYGYYTSMYGDRARFKEAVQFLDAAIHEEAAAGARVRIYSSVPGVAAFYIGVDSSAIMSQSRVQGLRSSPPSDGGEDQWFVVERDEMPRRLNTWLSEKCVVAARFEARSGPKDRTVSVYHCRQ
jgi:hypothetical protein